MKHKHAEVLRAIADGKEVERYTNDKWILANSSYLENEGDPFTFPNDEWRIKPEPRPDIVKYIGCFNFGNTFGDSVDAYHLIRFWDNKIKLTFDGETGKLKKVEVL